MEENTEKQLEWDNEPMEQEPTGDLAELIKLAVDLKEDIAAKKAALGILQKSYDESPTRLRELWSYLDKLSLMLMAIHFILTQNPVFRLQKLLKRKRSFLCGWKSREYFMSLLVLTVNHLINFIAIKQN